MAPPLFSHRTLSWPVKMAQFVPPSSLDSLSQASASFKLRHPPSSSGSWLPSKHAATVSISHNHERPSLALILQGRVHEEHFLSSLAFYRPRIRHLNEGSVSRGRVILASYKTNVDDKRHKFAMQFEDALQAELFYQTVKNLAAIDARHSQSFQIIDNRHSDLPVGLPEYDVLASCSSGKDSFLLGHESCKEPFVQATRIERPHMSTVAFFPAGGAHQSKDSVRICPRGETGPTSATGSESQPLSLLLPPRFPPAELQNSTIEESFHRRQGKGMAPLTNVEDIENDQALKEKIKACFLDPGFQVFVHKVEKIWHAMEKEMATEMSSIQDLTGNEANRSP